MAATPVVVPVEEYLRSAYRPDCDYVDGEVLERNVGEKPHARLQKLLLRLLEPFEAAHRLESLPEQRLQISGTRFRVPDLMLVSIPNGDEFIARTPPVLCIEILSSEDRLAKIRERIFEYARMGVPTSWAIDPWRRTAYIAGADGVLQESAEVLTVHGTAISISVAKLFAELDSLEQRASL